MTEFYSFAATVFVSFFAMMNPVANTPIFLSLTDGMSKTEKRSIAIQSNFLAFLIVTSFSFLGHYIFEMFGITLPALRITGGILIFLIGKEMLSGSTSEVHTPSEEDNQKSLEAHLSVAISPLATPILGGPGTIATAMSFTADKGFLNACITVAAFALLCLITCVFFLFGERFLKFIGESAIKVISRMMGLLLAVLGVQLLIEGIHGAIKLQ